MTTLSYPYDDNDVAGLELALSSERLGRYVTETGDSVSALQLYTWNCAVGGAFHPPLQALEVTLRNRVHDCLSAAFGPSWYVRTGLLNQVQAEAVDSAIDWLERRSEASPTPGKVVAELGFGFWTSLFSGSYDEALWRPHLHKLFVPRPKRRKLFDALDRLRTLRNRIAHHEPIYHRDLVADYKRIELIQASMCSETHDWVQHHSRVWDLLATLPEELERF